MTDPSQHPEYDFFEEDEPVEEVFAAFDRGIRGVTTQPPGLLPCIVCGTRLKEAFRDSSAHNQPSGGTVFTSAGQYGSTVFDPMGDREYLEITVCDRCMVKKAKEGVILHNAVVRYERPVYKIEVWAGPYEEGKEEDEGNGTSE